MLESRSLATSFSRPILIGLALVIVVLLSMILVNPIQNLFSQIDSTTARTTFYQARVKPKQRGDDSTWKELAKHLGEKAGKKVDERKLRQNVESCKNAAGLGGDVSIEIDDQTGDIFLKTKMSEENIGNALDGC